MSKQELMLWWEAREPSKADDARRLSRFVDGLPDFDPIYRSWLESPKTRKEAVPVPLTEAAAGQLLIDNIMRYETPPDPWPELGSNVWGGHAGPPPYDFRKTSYAATDCHVGAYGPHGPVHPNRIFMQLSELRPSTGRPWRASELRPLMRFAREVWSPAEMCVRLLSRKPPEIADPSWAGGVRTLWPLIGWITYLPPNLAAQAKYPADVEVETLANGAALVTLCEEPFDKTDAAGLARLHALEAALRPIQT